LAKSKEYKILYEHNPIQVEVSEALNEKREPVKKYKIKGIFSTIGERNRNGRIYPKEIWEREVTKYQSTLKSGSINRLMEWQHPERANVDPMEAVGAMDKLYIEGDYVMGEATLLDNAKANQLKTLIDNGIKISVSSRGVGSVRNGVVDNFNLITYDIVDTPSDYNATMQGTAIYESRASFRKKRNGDFEEVGTSSDMSSITSNEKSKIAEKQILEFIKSL